MPPLRMNPPRALRHVLAVVAVAAAFAPSARAADVDPAGGAGRVEQGGYTSLQGTYGYLAYLPVGWKRGDRLPLYVMLHGCATTPEEQMNANAMNPTADRERFIALYPDTFDTGHATGDLGQCWRGTSGADKTSELRGGGGDADAIAAMTRSVMARYTVDSERVYLMGMSAGAFQTSATGGAYPDIFAAIGVNAGGGYGMGVGCAAMTDDAVAPFAQLAITEMGARARPMPFFSIGGTADVLGEAPAPGGCARLAFKEWMATNNLLLSGRPDGTAYLQDDAATQKGMVPGGHPWTRYVWRDQDGCQIGERWSVDGMGHFWSGGTRDPKWAEWTDPTGPNAAEASWRFFKQFTLSGENASCAPPAGRTEAPAAASMEAPQPQAPTQAPQQARPGTSTQVRAARGVARLTMRTLRLKPGRSLRLALSCPRESPRGCRGTIALVRQGGTVAPGVPFSMASGDRATLRLRLSAAAHRLLRRHGSLTVRAVVRAADGRTDRRDVTLRRARRG